MSRQYFGIEIGDSAVRVASAQTVKGQPLITGVQERRFEGDEELVSSLADLLARVSSGDRLAFCLNAVGCFCRELKFPFSDARKIEAALELEMNSQIPSSEELVYDFQEIIPAEEGYLVRAVAVQRSLVEENIVLFNAAASALHIVDVNPFAYASGLSGLIENGLLVAARAKEVTVSRMDSGRVTSFRVTPLQGKESSEDLAHLVAASCRALTCSKESSFPLFCIGEFADSSFSEYLAGQGFKCTYPRIQQDQTALSPEFLPCAALALRAALPLKPRRLNFLKGDLIPKGEWTGVRSKLIGMGVLLFLAVAMTLTSAYLQLHQKNKLDDSLRQQAVSLFQQTFPDVAVIVDVPIQMMTKIDELKAQVQLLKPAERSLLEVLKTLSVLSPKETDLELRELLFDGETINIDATSKNFEASNRLARTLQDSPVFDTAQITDAKMAVNGKSVSFRLELKVAPPEEKR